MNMIRDFIVIPRLIRSLTFIVLSAVLVSPVLAQSDGGLQLGPSQEPSNKLDLGAGPGVDAEAPPSPRPESSPAPTPAPQQAVERVTHGDWDVACSPQGDQCAMLQIGNDEQGTPILEMVMRKLEEPLEVGDRSAVAVLDVITPLGVLLPEQLSLRIDEGPQQSADFQVCTEQGCLVREPIDADLVSRLKRGNTAEISVIAVNQGEVIASISLRGFTAAYDSL